MTFEPIFDPAINLFDKPYKDEVTLAYPDGEFVRFLAHFNYGPVHETHDEHGSEMLVSLEDIEILERGNIYAPEGSD